MATITLNIDDAALPRIVAGLCGAEGLAESGANARTALIRIAKRTIRIYEEVIEQQRIEGEIPIT
jgi:hypothetical protein